MDQSHAGVGFSAGHHNISRNQNIYAPRMRPVRYGGGGGTLFFKRLGVSVPGDLYSCESTDLRILNYIETNADGTAVKLVNKTWDGHPLTGKDEQLQPDGTYEAQNLSPNHSVDGNPNIGDPEGDIIGYYPEDEYNSGNNSWQHEEWDQEGSDGVAGSSGYDLLWPYQVQNPVHSTLPGVIAWYAYGWFTGSTPYSASDWNPAATGYGALAYNKATGDMTWAEYGDSAGAAVDVTTGTDEPYMLLSNNGASLLVFVDPDLLPTGSGVITVTTICVTALRVKTQIQYAGLGGDFSIFNDPDNPPPSEQPPAPTSGTGTPTFDSATDTSITFTWTAATAGAGASIAGHYIYRTSDGIPNGKIDTIGNVLTYTDNAVIDGVDYKYIVTAFDNWTPAQEADESAESDVMNVTATGSTNIIYPESEFDDSSAIGADRLLLWEEARSASTSFASGVCTITNGGNDSSQLVREVSDANGDGILNGGDYKLVIKASKGTNDLKVMVHSTDPNPASGNLAERIISDIALTEYELPFTTTASQEINIILRINSNYSGRTAIVDYCRIVDLN